MRCVWEVPLDKEIPRRSRAAPHSARYAIPRKPLSSLPPTPAHLSHARLCPLKKVIREQRRRIEALSRNRLLLAVDKDARRR